MGPVAWYTLGYTLPLGLPQGYSRTIGSKVTPRVVYALEYTKQSAPGYDPECNNKYP